MSLLSFLHNRLAPKQISYCPICRFSGQFLSSDNLSTSYAMCPQCYSLKMHRLLFLYLEQQTDIFHARLRVLDIGPLQYVMETFYALQNLHYSAIDKWPMISDKKMNLTELKIPDATYDCVICMDTLEYLSDDRHAMQELFRILKKGAWAIIQSRVDQDADRTLESTSFASFEERQKYFISSGHVRLYGRDYGTRLEEAGFLVKQRRFAIELGPVMIQRCSLSQSDIIYICHKPS